MPKLRAFLALPLAEYFSTELPPFLETARRKFSNIKWVAANQIHVTLHFFGDIEAEQVDKIERLITPIAQKSVPLLIGLESVGCFPSPIRPRVIWLGISGDTLRLVSLQNQIEAGLRDGSFECEDREFKAHATIGRLKDKFNGAISDLVFPATRKVTIDHLILYQSILSSEGPRYEVLKKIPFSQKP